MPALETNLIEEPELDTQAALADISADLFGQGESSADAGSSKEPGEKVLASAGAEETAPPAPDKGTTGVSAADPATPSTETSAEVQAIGAPKTWTKEALAEWAAVPPRVQQEIAKREQDFLNGITQYKTAAEVGQRYDSVVEPYRPAFAAENIDPVQLFQSFAANHYLLSRGTPAQKVELAASLINGYGIDFVDLAQHLGSFDPPTPVDPRVAALEAEVAQLRQFTSSARQKEEESARSAIEAEITAFAADPAYPHFDSLVDDMQRLFATGQAKNLKEAYETAVYLNPETRQKELDRLTAEKLSSATAEVSQRQAKIAAATAANLSSHQKPGNGTIPLGSMDDTLAETMARISARS